MSRNQINNFHFHKDDAGALGPTGLETINTPIPIIVIITILYCAISNALSTYFLSSSS